MLRLGIPGERYWGPLVPGSERPRGWWLLVIVRNLIPGWHWLRTQPALALRGAPLHLKLTSHDRLVILIGRRWLGSLRPRVMSIGAATRGGMMTLLESGPEDRARVRPAAEVFPDRPRGRFNEPGRQFLSADKELSELIVIEPAGHVPLLVWCSPPGAAALRAWAEHAAPEPPRREEWFPDSRSPDGRVEVRYDQTEVRMSIWVNAPTVVRLRDEREIVTLSFPWSCDRLTFPATDRVELELRRYPEGGLVTPVVVDVEAETFWFPGVPDETRPLSALPDTLRARREQQRAAEPDPG